MIVKHLWLAPLARFVALEQIRYKMAIKLTTKVSYVPKSCKYVGQSLLVVKFLGLDKTIK